MRRTIQLLASVVLAASGLYVLVYLFRWEWHRAIISALFFVAAEVGLVAGVLLRRLSRLEQRMEELAGRPGLVTDEFDPEVLARIREAAPPARNPFAWLDPKSPNLSVFLPFLIGIGALASGLAWVVEQMGRRITAPVLERRLAQRLTPLALPAGGLLGPPPRVVAPNGGVRSITRWGLSIAVATMVAAGAAAGVDWLGDAIQTRPEARRPNVSTRIDIAMRGARSEARPEQAAMILWGTCSHVLHGTVGAAAIRENGHGLIEVVVPTDIGRNAEQRLRGCLEDTVVDRVQATVLDVEALPSD
ncbi:MAG: hypothetical protein ACOYXM_11810 [Actinomycetota bacterium]